MAGVETNCTKKQNSKPWARLNLLSRISENYLNKPLNLGLKNLHLVEYSGRIKIQVLFKINHYFLENTNQINNEHCKLLFKNLFDKFDEDLEHRSSTAEEEEMFSEILYQTKSLEEKRTKEKVVNKRKEQNFANKCEQEKGKIWELQEELEEVKEEMRQYKAVIRHENSKAKKLMVRRAKVKEKKLENIAEPEEQNYLKVLKDDETKIIEFRKIQEKLDISVAKAVDEYDIELFNLSKRFAIVQSEFTEVESKNNVLKTKFEVQQPLYDFVIILREIRRSIAARSIQRAFRSYVIKKILRSRKRCKKSKKNKSKKPVKK